MTVSEAIEILEEEQSWETDDRKIDALIIAIGALGEIQKYKQGKLCLVPTDIYKKQCIELDAYKEIGTVKGFKALKEKSEAKKPIRNDLCTCPSCGTFNEVIGKRRNTVAFDTVYCWHCGQAIEIKRN